MENIVSINVINGKKMNELADLIIRKRNQHSPSVIIKRIQKEAKEIVVKKYVLYNLDGGNNNGYHNR